MTSTEPQPPRLDVMSLKGGVGKTTLAYALAWAQATRSRRPVLLIDADLTGTCLGDLLDPVVAWHLEANLAHLLCEPPDTLPEQLAPVVLAGLRTGPRRW
jgi:cellulose biosynthesis protein BcsQ